MRSGTEAGRRVERRSYGRVPLRVFVSVEYAGSEHTGGFCRDISKGGMYLFSESPLPQGSDVEVCIAHSPDFSQLDELIVAYGRVKRSERYPDGKTGAAVAIRRWARMDNARDRSRKQE